MENYIVSEVRKKSKINFKWKSEAKVEILRDTLLNVKVNDRCRVKLGWSISFNGI